jgi:tetratricopeptide (TPR) repeat protein
MSNPKPNRYLLIGSLLILCVSLGVYIYTLCPTVYWEDSAEFSAALGTLGLPHSPSFPLYVLTGHLFSKLPIGNVAFRTNLFSAFLASLSLVLLYYLTLIILSRVRAKEKRQLNLVDNLVALSSTLILAFTSAVWINAVRAEVYALNFFVLILLIFLIVKWTETRDAKLLFLFFFIYGLSFGNHSLLMFLCGPAFLYFIWANRSQSSFDFKRIILCLSVFILGLSIYLFLPLRSIRNPLMDWGDPQTLPNFVEAFTRKTSLSYHSSFKFVGIPYVLASLVYQFTPFVFWLGVIGFWVLFKKDKKLALFSLILLGTNMLCVAWAGAYRVENYDGQGYLIVSYSIYSIWIAMALGWGSDKIRELSSASRFKAFGPIVMILVLFLPFFPLRAHFQECNKRNAKEAYEFGMSLLSGVEKDAIILVNNASPLFISWYLKYVEKQGKEVKVIDRKTLKMESYRLHLVEQYPEIDFPTAFFNIRKLNRKDYLDSLKMRMALFIKETIKANEDKFPIYWEGGRDDSLIDDYLTPNGILFKVQPKKVERLTEEMIKTHYEFMEKLDARTKNKPEDFEDLKTKEYYSITLDEVGNYFYRKNLIDDALYHYAFSLRFDQQSPSVLNNLGVCLAKKGMLQKAVLVFEEALRIDPNNLDAHKNLGLCFSKLDQPEKAKYHWEKVAKIR